MCHFFVLTTFDVICDLLLNRRTATWNLFVKYIHTYIFIVIIIIIIYIISSLRYFVQKEGGKIIQSHGGGSVLREKQF